MKIITWNCNMAYRKKVHLLLKEKPDIVIIPECEHPEKLQFETHPRKPTSTLWFGKNKHKGLGIFSYGDFNLELREIHNPDFRHIIPVTVQNRQQAFTLYAIWAYNPDDPDGVYVEQVWKAINHYEKYLANEQSVLVGDFNSNTIWDKPRRKGNHSTVVRFLEDRNIHSAYHKFHNQQQGKEKHNTLFMYRHKDKPYHIDYCFTSASFLEKLQIVKVGTHRKWSKYSDHTPLIVSFQI